VARSDSVWTCFVQSEIEFVAPPTVTLSTVESRVTLRMERGPGSLDHAVHQLVTGNIPLQFGFPVECGNGLRTIQPPEGHEETPGQRMRRICQSFFDRRNHLSLEGHHACTLQQDSCNIIDH